MLEVKDYLKQKLADAIFVLVKGSEPRVVSLGLS